MAFALPALPYERLCESSSSFARASVRVTAAVAGEGCWGRDAIVASRNCRSQVEAMAPTSWANDAWSNCGSSAFSQSGFLTTVTTYRLTPMTAPTHALSTAADALPAPPAT